MNDNDKRLEDLSAYLDGYASEPERVRAEVEKDPNLAARLDQWQRLSDQLRQLEDPEVHPAFTTRVMASVREESERSLPLWRRVLVAGWAIPAVLVVFIAGTSLYQGTAWLRTDNVVSAPVTQAETPPTVADLFDLAQGDTYLTMDGAFQLEEDASEDAESELDLASSVELALDSDPDLDDMLNSLTAEEVVQLQQLMSQQAPEGFWS